MAPTTESQGAEATIDVTQRSVVRLVEQLRSRPGVVPFVGAGLSVPYGMLGWRAFLLGLAHEGGVGDEVGLLLVAGNYEEAAERVLEGLAPLAFDDALRDAFGDDAIREPDGETAVRVLTRIAAGPVVTTNFDRVLERTFAAVRLPFDRVVSGAHADPTVVALQQDHRYLFKVHGDVEDGTDRVLTRAEYAAAYGDPAAADRSGKPLVQLLHRMIESRTVLFLGCSLRDDRIVTLLEAAATGPGPFAHYAVLPRPASDAEY